MLFKLKRNITDVLTQNNPEEETATILTVFNLIKGSFPETSMDETARIVDFRRKTETNLTIFTITINGDKLCLSYNCSGLAAASDNCSAPDEEILSEVKDCITRLNYYNILEFYENHETITWKHEIYEYY